MAINLNFGSEVKIFYINVSYGVQNFQRIRSFSATKLIKSRWFNIFNFRKNKKQTYKNVVLYSDHVTTPEVCGWEGWDE